ncbi:hypothetical protein [Sphingopyxis flava]|uniref:Uncharacterized protein n=1 Tax=Sphingopyxis flava TaxID=1507287 RepID=A0A1T5BPT4_9SPHN|nr:hypothetical protein [Sphingopyxis flava]SKB49187.1 hypothetical protein SAMN06295937_100745 [Sphingopyxis flava]
MTIHPSWEAKPASIRFALAASAVVGDIREPAVAILDRLQRYPAAKQIEAAMAAAVVLATSVGLDAHDLVTRAKRQLVDLEATETSFLALADYAKGELK